MTEREMRNAEWKESILADAAAHCQYIDALEEELKERERMIAELATEIDRLRREQKAA